MPIPAPAAEENNNDRLDEKLLKDGAGTGPHGLAHADFARTFAHRHQHDVHHPNAAQQERGDADGAQEILHRVHQLFKGFGVLDGVPDGRSFLVQRIEAVQASQSAFHLRLAGAWSASDLGTTSNWSRAVGKAGGLSGKSWSMALKGTKILSTSQPS